MGLPSYHSMQSMQSVRSMLSTQSVHSMQNAPSSHLFESNRSSESEESEGSCELPQRIEIPSENEIYICGYGLKRTSENAWMSVCFDLSHVKEVTAGCVDGKIQADFKSLDAGFFGKTLSTMNEVVMMLSSTPSRIVLSLSNGTQKLFETALDVESAYFGLPHARD